MLKIVYFMMFIVGIIYPYSYFIVFLQEFGLNFSAFSEQMTINNVSKFFTADLLISAIALVIFIIVDGIRHKIKFWWLSILFTCFVGVSAGLPLFLFLKEHYSVLIEKRKKLN